MSNIGNSGSLSATKAFDVMRIFLESYWERGGRSSTDLALLLSSLERESEDDSPLDAAQWSDWLAAWQQVKAR